MGRAPDPSAHRVKGVGGPHDDVERVGAAHRGRAAFAHHGLDPVRGIGGHMRDQCAAMLAELVEEAAEHGLGAALRGPHQPTGVMVDDHGQVLLPAPVGDLVDADPAQPAQPVMGGVEVRPDPGDDRPHGAPGNAHQVPRRTLGRLGGQPRDRLIERQRVPRAVPGPRHVRHHHAMRRAAHPRRASLHEHPNRAQIQTPPPPRPGTAVITGTPRPAPPATIPSPPRRPHRDHHLLRLLVELDTLNDRLFDAQQGTP